MTRGRLCERVERVSGREEDHARMPEKSRRDRSSLQKPISSQLQINSQYVQKMAVKRLTILRERGIYELLVQRTGRAI